MQLARFKFNPLDVRQHPKMNQDMVPTFLMVVVYHSLSMNREINFLFWSFFMTLMNCNQEPIT